MSTSIGVCPMCRGERHTSEGEYGVLYHDCINCGFKSYTIPKWLDRKLEEEDEAERRRWVEEYERSENTRLLPHGGWN